jgi:hypothetical protein
MSHSDIANGVYDDALAQGAFASDHSLVLEGLIESGLHWEGRPICSVLRPLVVDARENQRRERAASAVARGIAIAADYVARRPDVGTLLRLTTQEEEWVAFEGGDTQEILGRLDGFVGDGQVQFLEYNPFPSGFAFADGLAARFEATAAFHRCADEVVLDRGHLVASFVEELRTRAPYVAAHGPLRLGIVTSSATDESLVEIPETAIVFQALHAAGVEVVTGSADALAYRAGCLELQSSPLHAVVVTNWAEFFMHEGRRSPLWAAVGARSVLVVNRHASGIVRGAKSLFAVLSDPEFDAIFPTDVRDALRVHVPWTRCVVDGKVTFHGRSVDLISHLRAHRRSLVLKPANGYGAIGVVLGWESTESAWDTAIEHAITAPYVVQERVRASEMSFPVVGPEGLAWRTFFLDWNPFIWSRARVHGALSRLCEQSIMNIQAGASSLVPVYTARSRNSESMT